MNAAAFIFSRHNRTTLASFWICSLLFMLGTAAVAQAQSLDTTFNPGANNTVRAVVVQADGKILVGGDFTTLGGGGTGTTTRNYLGRINADGSLDTSFNPGANGSVWALAVQADGKILVGGGFTGLGGSPSTGWTPRNNIGRLNANGSVDTSFNPGADGAVFTLMVQSDGKILVGGDFYPGMGRLSATGSWETSFDPGPNDKVWTVALQTNGKILIGGDFFYLEHWLTPRNHVGWLNANGSLDNSVVSDGANNRVSASAVQADGKILVGGQFSTLGFGGGLVGSATRNYIGRLNANGSLDTSFNPGANGYDVNALVVQPDGKILVGGFFFGLGGGTGTTTRYYLGRLNADGSVDMSFNPGANSTVEAMAVQVDGKILVVGAFTTLGGGGTGTTTRNYIGRLTVNAAPAITNPVPSSTLTSSSATFQWSSGTGVTNYYLSVGKSFGTNDIYGQYLGLNLSTTVASLPTDGRTLYVRLYWATATSGWQANDYTYTAYTLPTDTTPPTVLIGNPTSGQTFTATPITVSGTATDPGTPSSGVSLVQVQVNGTGGTWQTASGTTSWTTSAALSSGANTIYVRSKDGAGNYSTIQSVNVTYNPPDTTPPTVLIGSPTSGQTFTTTPITVSGTATDPGSPSSGVSLVQVQVNGTGGTWQTASGTTSWTASAALVSGANTIYVRSKDGAGNYSTIQSVNVTYNPPDTTPPTVSISAPTAGQHMTNALATFVGKASDNLKVASVWYQINSNAWSLVTSTTNSYTNWTQTVTLITGSNTFKTYARDFAGNSSTTQSLSVLSSNTFKLQLAFTNALPLKTNGLVFSLQLSKGLNGHIQVSSNLTSWATLTNFVGTNTTLNFRDPAATNASRRFYRAVIP